MGRKMKGQMDRKIKGQIDRKTDKIIYKLGTLQNIDIDVFYGIQIQEIRNEQIDMKLDRYKLGMQI